MHHKECLSGMDQWVVMDPRKQEKEKLTSQMLGGMKTMKESGGEGGRRAGRLD